MNETLMHQELKKQAVNILKSKGFSANEIKQEFKWKRFIIDVVAINDQKKIFIECGQIQLKKFKNLCKQKEAEFIYIPYLHRGVIKEPIPRMKVVDGIVTADTNILKVGNSFYFRIPYCIANDSQFPLDLRKPLLIKMLKDKLIVEEK